MVARQETEQTEIEPQGTTSCDDDLSPEEERFVEVFVEYWLRRGSQVVGSIE